jgi:mannose-6-phosphate isomerase-like protein (cupin superfamily)
MSEPSYHVAHLAEPGAVAEADLSRVFAAAWEQVAHLHLAPGEAMRRTLDDSDAMVFILGGSGTARLGDLEQPLREGISLTLFQGEPLDLEAAADQGLDLFLAEINVEQGGQG